MRLTLVRVLALALLATATSVVEAATISYSAVIDCSNNCVTVSLSWQNVVPGVSFAEVDDQFGNFLFGLSTPAFAQTTGSILPNPQTVSHLSSYVINAIRNSTVAAANLSLSATETAPLPTDCDSPYANLILQDDDHGEITRVRFIATDIPEPAVWFLTGIGLVLICARAQFRKKHSVSC